MSIEPLVSVIVPSYCHEEFIVDCLVSIHDQTFYSVELVVVDDASRDNTYEIIESLLSTVFSKRFANIILLRNEENCGAHASINRGIAASNGTHIAVINSDDIYHPERIALLMMGLEEKGAELGFTLVEVIADPVEIPEIPEPFRLFTLRQMLALKRERTTGFALMRANQAVSTGNMLFSRALYNRVGGFLPLKYCHDWDFLLQALYYTEPVAVMEPLYRYRLHETNSFSSLSHLAGIETEVVLRRFFRRGLVGKSPNPLFPNRTNWPGYFELFIHECEYAGFWRLEDGEGYPSWRIYEKAVR